MKSAILGGALLVIGAVLIATGVLPATDALAVADRVWPILLFVVAITVVTELAAEAELFRIVAERAARWGLPRPSPKRLSPIRPRAVKRSFGWRTREHLAALRPPGEEFAERTLSVHCQTDRSDSV